MPHTPETATHWAECEPAIGEWLVELRGNPADEDTLARVRGIDWYCERRANRLVLRSRLFEGLANVSEVEEVAFALMPEVNGLAWLCNGRYLPVTINGTLQVNEKGGFFLNMAMSRRSPPARLTRDVALTLAKRLEEAPALWELAKFVGHEPNWYGAKKTVEQAEKEFGGPQGLVALGMIENSQTLTDFKNNSTEHRHARGKETPRKMDRTDALDFVRKIVAVAVKIQLGEDLPDERLVEHDSPSHLTTGPR